MRRHPLDVALIGWPRCGTSSVFGWLDAHPRVTGSQPKETNFFFDSEHPLCGRHGLSREVHGLEAYASFFPEGRAESLRLDGSVHTFCQRTAMEEFSRWERPPLGVAILRQPSERILSSFRYTQGNLAAIRPGLSFGEYVELLLDGRIGDVERYYVVSSSFWIAARELEWGRYVDWLRRWKRAIGQDRLVILLLEEVRACPRPTLEVLCERLGLDSGFYDDFAFGLRNESRPPRSQGMHRFARRWGSRLPDSRAKAAVKRVYKHVQVRRRVHEKTNEEKAALRRLDDYFDPWNKELARLFGLDLQSWQVER